jgi:hypothetical protein
MSHANQLSRCYVFNEDSIEFLSVDTKWKFIATAQKTWTLVQLPIQKLSIEPTLLPLDDTLVIGGGEMVPGMINFMMFGVELKDSGEPQNKLVWSKPQIDNPIWAYG